MNILKELKRRNVFRMAALYAVAGWLIMQVAGVLMDLGALPTRFGPWILAALAVGLPIALLISWFYEITPEGLVSDTEAQEGQPTLATGGRRTDFVIIAMLAAAVILLLVWEPPASGDEALTVLPFESVTGPDEASFSQGLSIELQSLLAQLLKFKVKQPPKEPILGRFSDIPSLAEEMAVRWVLKGSVRRVENRVRIAVELIDAEDDAAIAWSNVFDRELSAQNLFNIQVEIARSITSELRLRLDDPAEQRLANIPTKNTEAYEAYLLGRQRLTDRKVTDLADAVEQFSLAIELDPQFAGAYSGLADACGLYAFYSGGHSNDKCPPSPAEREKLARKALALDPESGEAWVSLGYAIDEQVDSPSSIPRVQEVIAAFERGLELNPNQSQAYHWYGGALAYYFLYPDRPTGWLEAWQAGVWESVFDKGLEVDPLSIPLHSVKTEFPLRTRSKEDAIRHARRIIEIAPDSPQGYRKLGEQQWKLKGRIDESIRWLIRALEMDTQNPSIPISIGHAYSTLGDYDMALAYFNLAEAATAPDNRFDRDILLVEQAVIQLLSGKEDEHQMAELNALLSRSVTHWGFLERAFHYGSYVDFAMGRPADALATVEAFLPECLGAQKIPIDYLSCPPILVRIYQELGDRAAAQDLSDAIVDRNQLWADGWPADRWRVSYARALAAAGRTDEALDVLEELVSSGWRGWTNVQLRFTLYLDVIFDAIRDHERFRSIIATIEADMAQQLENVREMQRRGEIPTLEQLRADLDADQARR